MSQVIPEIAHQIALLPLLCLAWLHFTKRPRDVAWWWLASAFFVSWLADTAAHFADPQMISKIYPVTQAAIIGAVFLSRANALRFAAVLLTVGIVDVFWQGVGNFDILLRTVAWLSIIGIAYPLKQLGKLRVSLLVSFGVGWLCWMIYAIDPGWPSWGTYQLVRLLGIALFCWAATSPLPRLKIVSA